MSAPGKQPLVSVSAVVAAGLASATAAVITSRFGVAGTLIGAALTTMIITGGSAVLKAYLESMSGRVRRMPDKVRTRASRIKQPREQPQPPAPGKTLPGRADLRDNFVGRMRAALDWFRNLSPLRRRSILVGALVPALIAFLIGIGAITSVELVAGRSLSCLWNDCSAQAAGTGATGPRTTMGSLMGGSQVGNPVTGDPAVEQQQPVVEPQEGVQPVPADPAVPADPGSQAPAEPAPAQPAPAEPVPAEPVPADPSATPSAAPSAEPAPVE